MDNYTANRINTKEVLGVSINKNMSTEELSEKLKTSNIDFSSETKVLDSVSNLKKQNLDLFSNIESLKTNLEEANDKLSLALNDYAKRNTETLMKMDKFPHAGGSAILSNAELPLIPLTSGLTTIKATIKQLTEEVSKKTNLMLSNANMIDQQTDLIKEKVFEKVILLA